MALEEDILSDPVVSETLSVVVTTDRTLSTSDAEVDPHSTRFHVYFAYYTDKSAECNFDFSILTPRRNKRSSSDFPFQPLSFTR